MGTFGRYTRHLRGLDAITGERLEYRLPRDLYDALGFGYAQALCFKSGDEFLRSSAQAMAKLSDSKSKKTTAAHQPALRQKYEAFRKQYVDELARLRSGMVTGSVPVCVYPQAEAPVPAAKRDETRTIRRATALHERFHADMERWRQRRSAEGKLPDFGFLADFVESLPGGKVALKHSIRVFAQGGDPDAGAEELLARVEELRQVCKSGEAECDRIRANLKANSAAYDSKNPKWLLKFIDEVIVRYGSAMGLVGSAAQAAATKAAKAQDAGWDDFQFDESFGRFTARRRRR